MGSASPFLPYEEEEEGCLDMLLAAAEPPKLGHRPPAARACWGPSLNLAAASRGHSKGARAGMVRRGGASERASRAQDRRALGPSSADAAGLPLQTALAR